jgi:hypothetical protein
MSPLETLSMLYEYQKQASICNESNLCDLLVEQRNDERALLAQQWKEERVQLVKRNGERELLVKQRNEERKRVVNQLNRESNCW